MRNYFFVTAVMALSITWVLSSCKKENSSTPADTSNNGTLKVFTLGKITTVQNLPADTIIGIASTGQPYGSGKYTFFSIERKEIVASSDSATLIWDLGFRGTTIIINGGIDRAGNGGAFIWNGVFDNITSVPADSTFQTDNAGSYAIPIGSGKGWYNYNGPVNLVTPIPGKVLIIRTASGKYAKMEILNYYKGGETPSSSASDDIKLKEQRYYSFRFIYQPEGTMIF